MAWASPTSPPPRHTTHARSARRRIRPRRSTASSTSTDSTTRPSHRLASRSSTRPASSARNCAWHRPATARFSGSQAPTSASSSRFSRNIMPRASSPPYPPVVRRPIRPESCIRPITRTTSSSRRCSARRRTRSPRGLSSRPGCAGTASRPKSTRSPADWRPPVGMQRRR